MDELMLKCVKTLLPATLSSLASWAWRAFSSGWDEEMCRHWFPAPWAEQRGPHLQGHVVDGDCLWRILLNGFSTSKPCSSALTLPGKLAVVRWNSDWWDWGWFSWAVVAELYPCMGRELFPGLFSCCRRGTPILKMAEQDFGQGCISSLVELVVHIFSMRHLEFWVPLLK